MPTSHLSWPAIVLDPNRRPSTFEGGETQAPRQTATPFKLCAMLDSSR